MDDNLESLGALDISPLEVNEGLELRFKDAVRLQPGGEAVSLKRFGGPGEIRTHDLFHAI